MSEPQHPFKSPNFICSLRYAANGLREVLGRERNFQAHCVLAVLVTAAGFLLEVSRWEWAVLVLCMTVMMAVEILNTAIEYTVDMLSGQERTPAAGIVKDVSAGACLLTACGVALTGAIVFIPHLLARLSQN